MHYLFAHLPGWVILMGFILIAFVVTYVVFRTCRIIFPHEELESNKDATGVFVNMIGVLYGVLLAFIVIAIWEHYDKTKDNVQSEADALGNIYSDAQILPPAVRNIIDSTEKRYATIVVEKEWSMMEKFQECEEAVMAENRLEFLITHLKPENSNEERIYSQIVSYMNNFTAARRSRVSETTAEIPAVFWFILLVGAVLLIFYMAFFYISSMKFQLWLGFGVSALIAILIFVAFDLNFPFTGSSRIGPDAFQTLLNHTFKHIDSFNDGHLR
jgi:hypothetical protein